jgi:pimeloyl-ACP methyl ester carboxylesterase
MKRKSETAVTRLPFLLIPGLNCSARIFAHQIPALWPFGAVGVADHMQGGSELASIAAAILGDAPPRFALAGLSMGGYLALEIMRQAPERVGKLALIDTSARPDTPEQTERRRVQIDLARNGRFSEIPALQFSALVDPSHVEDKALFAMQVAMAGEVGAAAFVRQQEAIIARPDSRQSLGAITCPTLVIVGESDKVTLPEAAQEMADAIAGAKLVIIAAAGHLALVEQPEAVNAALVEWARG